MRVKVASDCQCHRQSFSFLPLVKRFVVFCLFVQARYSFFVCKFFSSFFRTNTLVIFFSNIIFLILYEHFHLRSSNRYFAIVHPLKSRMQQSKRRTCRILVAVWALAAFGSAPNFLSAPQAHDYLLYSEYGAISRRSCIPTFSRHQRVAYFTALFLAFYLIPLMLIAFTCFCIARSLLRTSVLRRQGSLLRQEVNRRKVCARRARAFW